MLDDLKYIHSRDAQDALGIAEKQWQQLSYGFELAPVAGEFENIVYAGMGGSALAALISQSYSGNTEETLSALAEAEAKGARITIIAGGGKLKEVAEAKGYPVLVLPKAEQPRYAVFYNLVALVTLLKQANLLIDPAAFDELPKAGNFLQEAVKAWLPTVPADNNPAKKMALDLAGKSPVIYGGPLMAPAAYKWKISFNENAKNVAWWGQYPEFNHNEFIGWSSHPVDKPYGVIDLRSNLEHERVQHRFELSDRLLSGKRPAAYVVQAQGTNLLEQLLWTINFGDFASIYLALLNGLNPAPVELVEKFKKELN
jgi:glucose/mannose-6-phosphate isomerase